MRGEEGSEEKMKGAEGRRGGRREIGGEGTAQREEFSL